MSWIANVVSSARGMFEKGMEGVPVNAEVEGNKIHGILYQGTGVDAIIYLHGAFEFGEGSSDCKAYVKAGYSVLMLKYDIEGTKECKLEADVMEARNAAVWMRGRFKSLRHIYAIGVSRGGYVLLWLALSWPGWFRKFVCMAGPVDIGGMFDGSDVRLRTRMPAAHVANIRHYFDIGGSPLDCSKPLWKKPLLYLSGSKDVVVPPGHGELLHSKVPLVTYQATPYGHGLANEKEVQDFTIRWLSVT